jgi:hypothetical protein
MKGAGRFVQCHLLDDGGLPGEFDRCYIRGRRSGTHI